VVNVTTTLELHCDVCARLRVFSQPACVEDHGGDCPDWACTGCGAALMIAPLILLVDRSTPVELRRRVRSRITARPTRTSEHRAA
jgi:hypothetical protein